MAFCKIRRNTYAISIGGFSIGIINIIKGTLLQTIISVIPTGNMSMYYMKDQNLLLIIGNT